MRIAKIIGTVTLNRCHPSSVGANLQYVAPFQTGDLVADREPTDEELVAWDELGAGLGSLDRAVRGYGSGQPFLPDLKPVDAYVAAMLDQLDVDQSLLRPMVE